MKTAGRTCISMLALALALAPLASAQRPGGAPPAAPVADPTPVKTAAEFAAGYSPPRTETGRPDFQGIWTNASVTRMERSAGTPLVLTREQADQIEGRSLFNVRLRTEKDFVDPNTPAPEKGRPLPGVGNYDVAWTDPGAAVANIKGELRSSYLTYPATGRIPEMTDAGKKLRAAVPRRLGSGFDNPEERGLSERCVIIGTNGPPFGNYLYNNNFQIVQTAGHLMVMSEMIHDSRIFRIGGKHSTNGVEPWMGDSIAWWEGDTLVTETKNIHPSQRNGGTFLSKDGKVIERFTRISDDQILYEFEIDDPTVYTSVWKGQMPLYKAPGVERVYEYACHEGNYGLQNILEGGRLNDRLGRAQTGGEQREE